MAQGMVIELPAAGSLGSDEDFDLRVLLERELDAALAPAQAGGCGRGEVGGGRMIVRIEAVTDPADTFRVVKDVLSRLGLLHRAVVLLETRREGDSDEADRQTLWPRQPARSHVA